MSGQRHPDTEALADYRAGLIGGFRRRRLAAHVAGCAQCASVSEQLDAVGTMLASVPAPAVPDEVERRVAAALAAEATARQAEGTGTARQAAGTAPQGEGSGPARRAGGAARGGVPPGPGGGRRRRPGGAPEPAGGPGPGGGGAGPPRRFRPVMTLVPVAACLLLAGFGYLLSNI